MTTQTIVLAIVAAVAAYLFSRWCHVYADRMPPGLDAHLLEQQADAAGTGRPGDGGVQR